MKTIAQRLVEASVQSPGEAWAIIAVNSGGLHMGQIDGHRFPDDSAVVYIEKLTRDGRVFLPVVYVGAGPSWAELDAPLYR